MSTKTKQQSTNTYGWQQNPGSADINALRDMKATIDPSIPYFYAQKRKDLEGSYNNPMGAATSAATRDNAMRAAGRGLDQMQGQAIAESQYNADNSNYARQSTVAGLTAPHLTQTGGTSTQTQSQNPLAMIASIAGGVGSAAMGNPAVM